MTSLVELSEKEAATAPPDAPQIGEPPMEAPAVTPLKDNEFESLEEFSKHAPAEAPPPEGLPALEGLSAFPETPGATPGEAPEATPNVLGGPATAESPATPGVSAAPDALAPDALAAAPATQSPADAAAPPAAASADTGAGAAEGPYIAASERESPAILGAPAAATPGAPTAEATGTATGTPAPDAPGEGPSKKIGHAPPPMADKKEDFAGVRAFGEKLGIGLPRVEASPPFSLFATGSFDEKSIEAIQDAITSEDFGVGVKDISVQLAGGKLFVPRISEFAAVLLAQKIRDFVDNIEIGPAGEIFKSGQEPGVGPDEILFVNSENYSQHREELRNIEEEPASEKDVFTTNLGELKGFEVTKVLATVTASEVIAVEVAENPSSREFEQATERLTRTLVGNAFKLGAQGVIGVAFSLGPLKINKAGYRLLATGTAVRTRKLASPPAPAGS